MNTAALREQIQKARQTENETGRLKRQLEAKLPHLHSAIQLPDANREDALTSFVTSLPATPGVARDVLTSAS